MKQRLLRLQIDTEHVKTLNVMYDCSAHQCNEEITFPILLSGPFHSVITDIDFPVKPFAKSNEKQWLS